MLHTASLPAKGPDDGTTLVKDLKNEIQALKSRCNMLETTVKNLESIYNTHQRTLETLRQHIVNLHSHLGTLDLSYQGEELEVIL
jgi:predicted  nucleic acid-binding Zn-ribbon protein